MDQEDRIRLDPQVIACAFGALRLFASHGFAVKKKALDLPTVTTAIDLLRSEAFLAVVSGLKGYDASAAGRIIGMEEAFAAG